MTAYYFTRGRVLIGDSGTTFKELAEKTNKADVGALMCSYGPLLNELRYTPLMYLAEHGNVHLKNIC